MFGVVTAYPGLLTQEQNRRYRECYCGLCRSLRDRHGEAARLTLTYDMTFLVLLLSSLYEPEDERRANERCAAHPFKEHSYVTSSVSDYAADMNIALAYLKCLDDWRDEESLSALGEAKLLEGRYKILLERYPRQCSVMEKSISELSDIERSRKMLPDEASECFGRLMGELLVMTEDRWSEALRRFGMALGQFIYIMDACLDLKQDKRYYRYNPLAGLYGRIDEREHFKDILEMLMARCVDEFERLPLVQDADIIRNILCFGVWMRFNKHYGIKGAAPDGTGPI